MDIFDNFYLARNLLEFNLPLIMKWLGLCSPRDLLNPPAGRGGLSMLDRLEILSDSNAILTLSSCRTDRVGLLSKQNMTMNLNRQGED